MAAESATAWVDPPRANRSDFRSPARAGGNLGWYWERADWSGEAWSVMRVVIVAEPSVQSRRLLSMVSMRTMRALLIALSPFGSKADDKPTPVTPAAHAATSGPQLTDGDWNRDIESLIP